MSMTWAADKIKGFSSRIMSLNEDIKARNSDKSEVYKEARANGFDVKALRKTIAKIEAHSKAPQVEEETDALVEMYFKAITGTELALRVRARDPDMGIPISAPAKPKMVDTEATATRTPDACVPAGKVVWVEGVGMALASLPPHDSDGVVIEEPDAEQFASAGEETAIVKGDGVTASLGDASPTLSDPVSGQPDTEAGTGGVVTAPSSSPATIPENAQRPSNRDVSTDGEPSSAAASQGQAAHAGTGSETLASHEGRSEGEGASALSPPIPQPAAGLPTPAVALAVEHIPPDVAAAGAPFELEDIPPGLDRRSKAA